MVLKKLISDSFFFGRVWWFRMKIFPTVSTLASCGGLEETDFQQFLLWEGVVVLNEDIFNSFYFRQLWWYYKN